jgi:NADH-dependent peroxiredoxin subunit F
MLDDTLKAQLKAYLERVTQPFELWRRWTTADRPARCVALLQTIASLSDKITLRTDGNDARKPSFSLQRPATA